MTKVNIIVWSMTASRFVQFNPKADFIETSLSFLHASSTLIFNSIDYQWRRRLLRLFLNLFGSSLVRFVYRNLNRFWLKALAKSWSKKLIGVRILISKRKVEIRRISILKLKVIFSIKKTKKIQALIFFGKQTKEKKYFPGFTRVFLVSKIYLASIRSNFSRPRTKIIEFLLKFVRYDDRRCRNFVSRWNLRIRPNCWVR